jgi:hypothetical protein
MITVLVVGPRERTQDFDAAASRNPSIELIHAAELEEALDRLARNRRIDAVLLLVETAAAREIAQTLLEEDPAAPPIFVAGSDARIEGINFLEAKDPNDLLIALTRLLSAR